MNGSIRVSAKTVDDAITEAMIQLGVTSDRLEYEVIEKGSSGFLGIGMKQAVIEQEESLNQNQKLLRKNCLHRLKKSGKKKQKKLQSR